MRMISGECRLSPLLLLLIFTGCGSEPPAREAIRELRRELGSGSFDLTDTRAGLASLSGYEAALTVSFEGSKEGRPLRWSSTSTFRVSTSPPARQVTIRTSGMAAEPRVEFMAERDGAAYGWSAADQCAATSLDSTNSMLRAMEPAALLGGVLGAEAMGTERVNGVQTTRYTFDERALGESGLNRSTGELWVASKGGHLVRYRLATTGDSGYFGGGAQGRMTWDYQLTGDDQSQALALPASCPPGLVEAPMLPNASKVQRDPGVLQYETTGTVAEAAAFHERELGALGWKSPSQSNPMPSTLGLDPKIRQMMSDPRVRAAMNIAGLDPAIVTPSVASADDDAKAYLLFRRGSRVLRVLITRGEPDSLTTRIVVLGRTER